MLRIMLAALAAMLVYMSVASAADLDPDQIEDMAFYTPDYKGPIAALNWDPDNSPIHPDLAAKIMYSLPDEYAVVTKRDDLRFAGHHMVLVEGCGGYLNCGVVFDLTIGQPVLQLPVAGPGGYVFYSDCDWLEVYPPDPNHPERVTEPVFYRLTPKGLSRLSERYPDCITYPVYPDLPVEGPFPLSRPYSIEVGS